MRKEVWRYGAMKAVLNLGADGVLRITVTGLCSRDAMEMLRQQSYETMSMPGVKAIVVDFRRATLLIGEASVSKLVPGAPPEAKASMPVAFVCSEADEPVFLLHAWQMAQDGLTRSVFTDPVEASLWALARVAGSSVLGYL